MREDLMLAVFLIAAKRLEAMCPSDIDVVIKERVKNKMSSAIGTRQDIMFLIGNVAANGEDCLYRVEIL